MDKLRDNYASLLIIKSSLTPTQKKKPVNKIRFPVKRGVQYIIIYIDLIER